MSNVIDKIPAEWRISDFTDRSLPMRREGEGVIRAPEPEWQATIQAIEPMSPALVWAIIEAAPQMYAVLKTICRDQKAADTYAVEEDADKAWEILERIAEKAQSRRG